MVEVKGKRQLAPSKYFLITDNKPNLALWDKVKDHAKLHEGVWQLEKAPKTKRLHVQAFVGFKAKTRPTAIKKLFGMNHLHIEKAMHPDKARKYCKKEDSRHYFEDGTCYMVEFGVPQIGKAGTSDEASAIKKITEGKTVKEVAQEHPAAFVRRGKGLQALRSILQADRVEGQPIEGLYIYGPTGTGKTTFAINYAKRLVAEGKYKSYFLQQPKGNWFDCYDGEEILILNEITGDQPDSISYNKLLAMFDPYSMELPIKTSFVKLRAKLIILTSNLHIDGCFRGAYNQGQLKRRMTLGMIEMKKKRAEVKPVKIFASAEDFEAGVFTEEKEEEKKA